MSYEYGENWSRIEMNFKCSQEIDKRVRIAEWTNIRNVLKNEKFLTNFQVTQISLNRSQNNVSPDDYSHLKFVYLYKSS